jgi:hypothetical protein
LNKACIIKCLKDVIYVDMIKAIYFAYFQCTAVVLRCGKQMEKLPHYHFSWIVSFQKQRYHVREMLPLDLGDRRGYSHLKEEALDHNKWRNRFGRGCGRVI